MSARQVVTAEGTLLVLVQTEEGERIEYRGHNSHRVRTATVGRKWDVFLGYVDPGAATVGAAEKIGFVTYEMRTRETKSKGRTYVNTRWRSPGWAYGSDGWTIEVYSKTEALERIVRAHKRRTT